MSNHQKRLSVPKSWPVERKTETFTVKADAGPHGEAGVPLLILVRDVLGYVDTRKEARYALNQDNVVINGKAVSDEERPVGMFDIMAFDEREEYYRVFPDEGGRLALTPIDEDSARSKLGKIVGKRQLSGGRTQLTLHDGHTLLVDDGDPYAGSDSIVIANADDEIVAHFPAEVGALVTAVAGEHAGEIGTIDEIQVTPGSSPNNVIVEQEAGDGFETIDDYVVVIDENFVGGDSEAGTASEQSSSAERSSADSRAAEPRDDDGTRESDGGDGE
jgi:small subunit ribosomal protein S4e